MAASAESHAPALKRFNLLTENDIDSILNEKDSKNTKKATKYAVGCFNQFLAETADADSSVSSIDHLSPDELDQQLTKFFAGARKVNGTKYKKTSFTSLRFGIARYVENAYKIDITNDPRFHRSAEVYKAVLVELKRGGKAGVCHYPEISSDDLKKLYTSEALSTATPKGLQSKVWCDVMFYTCRRGRENLRLMDKETFSISTDATGRAYVFQQKDELDKNHRENDAGICTDGRMYEWPGHPLCPVASYKKYLEKLQPGRCDLWQRPAAKVGGSGAWYINPAVGVNTLGALMKNLSAEANLSRIYTNHSIRATMISTLDSANFEARHIMNISGHKSESSIRSYSRGVTEEQKLNMFSELSRAVAPLSESLPAGQNDNEETNSDKDFSSEGDQLLLFSHADGVDLTTPGPVATGSSSTHIGKPIDKSGQNNNVLNNVLNLPVFPIVPRISH